MFISLKISVPSDSEFREYMPPVFKQFMLTKVNNGK